MKMKQVNQLSFSPSIWMVPDLLTPGQCDHLIQVAEGRLERSMTVDPVTGKDMIISQRSSEQTFLELGCDTFVAEIETIVADLLEMPVENGEPFQILRYELGQEYEPHHDFFEPLESGSAIHLARGGQRVATVLLYLTDVEEGGETIFPNIGLVVTPKRGSALVFYNLFDNGQQDPDTLHGSLPVKKGTKWVATKWVRQNKFVVEPDAETSEKPQEEAQCPYHQGNGAAAPERPSDRPEVEASAALQNGGEEFSLRVWRLHPQGVRIEAADKTLMGDAPSGAVRWCGPFTHANAYGFWLYSPIDVDITWHGGRSFEYDVITPYSTEDYDRIKALQTADDKYQYEPRQTIDAGGVIEGVFSLWTGCAFQTPPGWSLMIRSVINKANTPIFKIQEGILETDWLSYDIWMNLQFQQQGKKVSLRRASHMPIAQIVPVPREAYDKKWELTESLMERQTPEGEAFYQRWVEYNYKKWVENARKEPYTYHSERARHLKKSRHETE